MARVVRFHQTGGPEVLQIENLEVPPPGKGEVQISVKALGLNRAEAMFRRGQYLEDPKLPARLGYEAASTVSALGPGIQGFKVGDAVSTIPAFSLNQYGLYGDLANPPVHAVTHHPASLSLVEAAAVWMQYLTAYGALIDIARLGKGDTVLIPAASSSVGLAAIQIANRVGAVPVALTRGSSKRQALADAGAAHVIATEEQDLVKEVLGVTGGKGARVVFDPVGGPTVNKLVQATARSGIVFLYGALSTEPTPLPPGDLTPPYWINMGAMAISTLAGVCLVGEAARMPVLTELLPFVKGMTLLFWATATWWIPMLVALGAWRHLLQRVPLTYEHGYWAAVFPLGMYTACTQNLIRVFQLPFLDPIATGFVWIALGAWAVTFGGLAKHLMRRKADSRARPDPEAQQQADFPQGKVAT